MLQFHPPRASLITVRYEPGFKEPEMVKRRLAVVMSLPMKTRPRLITVVPLSTSEPERPAPYHCKIRVPFELPDAWGDYDRWVKADMVCALGWHRCDLLTMGKDHSGRRQYQTQTLPPEIFAQITRCMLHGLGLSQLARNI